MQSIAVGFSEKSVQSKAELLAQKLMLDVNNDTFPQLRVTPERIELIMPGFSPLFVDFEQGRLQARKQAGKKQGLVQACKPVSGQFIIDATAGWGKDSAILAAFGANVLMIERNPVMAVLLQDGLDRLGENSSLSKQLSLHVGDAISYLNQLDGNSRPDVVYIDPMHPERQKKALVKKNMQALQQLLGADDDALILLESAKSKVRQRVVMKWPRRHAPLLQPITSYTGKTVRFDVY